MSLPQYNFFPVGFEFNTFTSAITRTGEPLVPGIYTFMVCARQDDCECGEEVCKEITITVYSENGCFLSTDVGSWVGAMGSGDG